MRRLTAVVLACILVAAGLLRSHFLPLCLLALMGALGGLLIATQMSDSRELLRVPAMVALTVLVLVGVGQLGAVGILLGVALLLAAIPIPAVKSRPGATKHPSRHGPR